MNDLILTQLSEEFKKMVEKIMIEERKRYLKEHKNTRANGYYTRRPKTILGEMELNVPRTRDGEFKSSVLPERKRFMFALDDIVKAMFISGISARKTGRVLENLVGSSISPSFVSSLSDVAEEEVERFKSRRLTQSYPVLYLDATYVALKRDSVQKEAVYAVLGLRDDGKREILTYTLPGGDEKASIWREIFEDLINRGLKGVRMIVSDNLTGLDNVIDELFPDAEHQLCWFHLKKNLKNKARKRHWDEIKEELDDILDSDTQEEAKKKMQAFVEKWSRLYRHIVNLKSKINNYLHFLKFPKNIRIYLRTTNWMERCFKELKDSLRIRGYMHSEKSAEKFLYLFFTEKNSKYLSRKLRYSDTLQEVFNGWNA